VSGGVGYQPVLDVINSWVTGRPKTIIAVFLVVTVLFGLGLPSISIDPGEEGFTEGTDEQEALDAVNEEFDRPFTSGEETTQLIQRNENVLSKEGVLRMLRLLQS
jgi:predicted RND superfamily exporter protein